jgi:hypothetical protein
MSCAMRLFDMQFEDSLVLRSALCAMRAFEDV